jgi:hypothetical protein
VISMVFCYFGDYVGDLGDLRSDGLRTIDGERSESDFSLILLVVSIPVLPKACLILAFRFLGEYGDFS